MTEDLKRLAGEAAIAHVRDGMTVGLGTGSTAAHAIRKLAAVVRERGWTIRGVPTSIATERLAASLGLPLATLDEVDSVDVAIDGADEVDPKRNLIKGAGGAHLREKLVARAAAKVVIAVDASKLVPVLGTKAPVPVEVHPFGWRQTKNALEALWCTATLRTADGDPFWTDNGNYILDCKFGPIPKPEKLEREINNVPGVLENGLFVGLAHVVVVAGPEGLRTMP
ncbi:MAG: ribose-5-phosphate isomerase RpiA [Euryarchaeota archaeon]|nr:ribose-5-phosphate isomerase RpiA [Euryarchaeota archaeon]